MKIEQSLLFGTAYYAEYMPYDRVETDLDIHNGYETYWRGVLYRLLHGKRDVKRTPAKGGRGCKDIGRTQFGRHGIVS